MGFTGVINLLVGVITPVISNTRVDLFVQDKAAKDQAAVMCWFLQYPYQCWPSSVSTFVSDQVFRLGSIFKKNYKVFVFESYYAISSPPTNKKQIKKNNN